MKQKATILSVAMACAVLLGSCGTTGAGIVSAVAGDTTAATTAATDAATVGSNIGTSLLALYKEKKSAGGLNLNSAASILQLASLAENVSTLKSNLKNKTYLAEAAAGLVSGSAQTVSEANAPTILNTLAGASTTSADASSLSTALTSILPLLGK